MLSAEEFDLTFDFGRNAVACGRTISPRAHRFQNVTVAGEARTLQNEWAVHAPVCPDNEADFDLLAMCRWREERIGSG